MLMNIHRKLFFSIKVTEEGIVICVNEHPQKAFFFQLKLQKKEL